MILVTTSETTITFFKRAQELFVTRTRPLEGLRTIFFRVMSSSATGSAKRVSHPITQLDSDIASVFTHVHPLLVLFWFLLQFNATVANPVSSLSSLLLSVCITQMLYVVICLPAVGTGATSARSSGSSKSSTPLRRASLGKKFTVSGSQTAKNVEFPLIAGRLHYLVHFFRYYSEHHSSP